MKKSLLSLVALLMAGTTFAQVNFTFNRTSAEAAEVSVAKDGEAATGVTATIAISGAVEEFVIVMVEFPLIAKDPVALILNL